MADPVERHVACASRRGRLLLHVGGRVFAVRVGRRLVLRLPPERAAALVGAGLALSLDPGGDSLLRGWVVLAPVEDGTVVPLAREACRFAREATREAPMSPGRGACHTPATVKHETGGTMAAPFVWFDLQTTDEAESLAFYRELLDWQIDGDAGMPAMVKGADGPWAAVAPSDGGASQWVPYVQVDDVDAAAERAGSLGATILHPKRQGPAGQYAVIADPAGARIALWQPPAA